jgi:hypothetical protein
MKYGTEARTLTVRVYYHTKLHSQGVFCLIFYFRLRARVNTMAAVVVSNNRRCRADISLLESNSCKKNRGSNSKRNSDENRCLDDINE